MSCPDPSSASPSSSVVPVYRYVQALPEDLFTALTHCHHQANTEQTSYWMSVEQLDSPSHKRLLVEQVITHLYHSILNPAVLSLSPSSCVGVEWWLHRRCVDAGMFMHFDRDESRWMKKRECVFPCVSSVLFLTPEGGPTLIVQQSTNKHMSCMQPSQPVCGYAVFPISNSLVVFPGHWLHGVLPVSADPVVPGSNLPPVDRVTLVMNVWTEPLQDPTCIELTDEQTKQSALQQRYGSPLSMPSMRLISQPVPAVLLQPMTGEQISELYEFDLPQYTRDAQAADV